MVRLKTMVASSASISILFDLGDGAYDWSPAFVPDPSAVNATWNATLAAAGQLGLDIRWTWYACCGVAVTDVGNRSPPSGFVGLFRWNGTQSRWEFASTGLSTLVLTDGDAIALYNAAFDGVTFAGRYPVPTPLNPYPAIQFRGDASNTGASKSKAPHTLRVLWDHDTGVSEIGSTPSVAYGKVFVNSRNGLFALNDSTGGEVWRNPVVRGMSSPAVFDGGLIVGGSDGRVHWVNATSGAERWNVSLLTTPGFSGITSSPKQILDRVYIGTFNESSGSGEVVSFWASNGTIAWRHPTGSVHFSSPAIANGMVYVGVMGTYNRTTGITFDPPFGILAVSAADGSMKWFFPTNDSVAASPLIDGNLVISPSKNGNVYSVNATTGTEIWRANVGAGISSPAEHGGILFVGGGVFDEHGKRDGLFTRRRDRRRRVAVRTETGAIHPRLALHRRWDGVRPQRQRPRLCDHECERDGSQRDRRTTKPHLGRRGCPRQHHGRGEVRRRDERDPERHLRGARCGASISDARKPFGTILHLEVWRHPIRRHPRDSCRRQGALCSATAPAGFRTDHGLRDDGGRRLHSRDLGGPSRRSVSRCDIPVQGRQLGDHRATGRNVSRRVGDSVGGGGRHRPRRRNSPRDSEEAAWPLG